MKKKIYDHYWGPVPNTIAPSSLVRRWDQGVLGGLATFGGVYCCVSLALYRALPGSRDHLDMWWSDLQRFPVWLYSFVPGVGELVEAERFWWFTYAFGYKTQAIASLGIAGALATWMAHKVIKRALEPRSNKWWIGGPVLLQKREAEQEARRRSITPKQALTDPYALYIHPAWHMSKKAVSTHFLIYGAVGSGKTQVMLQQLNQVFDPSGNPRKGRKAFIYDIKGDFTSYYKAAAILSPFDKRSKVWLVGKDVCDVIGATAFANSLIPETGKDPFWSIGPQMIITGLVLSLQRTKGTSWGFKDLADLKNGSAEELLAILEVHYPAAVRLIENTTSTTTSSLLSTMAGHTRVIDQLAMAWPTVPEDGSGISLTDWIQDDYKGRKQIIVQAGKDENLTRGTIAAMLNAVTQAIISPSFEENEQGRYLGFFLDELGSIGKVNFQGLVDKGRSKGTSVVIGVQNITQIEKIYGKEDAEALESMIGTHIICKQQMGATRDKLAGRIGKGKVAFRNYDPNAQIHEESKAVVSSNDLTDLLGFDTGKDFGKVGKGIRAIIQTSGDPLLLNFPLISPKKQRRGQVAAEWTKKPLPVDQASIRPPKKEERPIDESGALSDDEIDELLR